MTTFDRLKTVFERVFEGEIDINGLGEHSRLKEDIGLNSIGMLYMAIALEEEFGVKFTNEDLVALSTAGDVVARLEASHK